MLTEDDNDFMHQSIQQAALSVQQGGFPAGAIIVKDGKVIGTGVSISTQLNDPTNHGDIAAIRNACQSLQKADLAGASLYTSLEPCLMCLGGAAWANISRLIFACRKNVVDAAYYIGMYETANLNATLQRPIAIVHHSAYEAQSLAVIRQWEQKLIT